MSTAKKGQSTSHYQHTQHLSARRRSLFPEDIIDSEEESDLGHISPLSFDSDRENLKYLVPMQGSDNGLSKTAESIGDYDILGVVENMQEPTCTPITNKNYPSLESMSPLYLSPYCSRLNSIPENIIVNETPFKMSPSYNLKTPHDAPNTNSKLPKLVRKSLLDALESTSVKRKLSPLNSPEENQNKHLKLDPNSKVRTTLFPEVDISLPTKSFYPKTDNIMEKLPKRDTFHKSLVPSSTSRKGKSRKKIGQINAGVSHKIRKPKQQKLNKTLLVKAATNLVNNCAINEYIKDLKELNASKNEQIKLIENKENANPKLIEQEQIVPPKLIERNVYANKTSASDVDINKKRPRSPVSEPDPNKKFFKFSRTRCIVTVNKNMKVQVDNGKMTLLENQNKKKNIPKIVFDSSDLTVEEEILPESNIDSILSLLENDKDDQNVTQIGTKIVLQAHSSVSASENSILLHTQSTKCNANLILSPISQMCDVTSGLALNSPKKVKNLTSILNDMPNALSNISDEDTSTVMERQKLFPVFCARNSSIVEKKDNKILTRTAKKIKNIEESQMLLDAGQKKFGITLCGECDFLYHIGDPSDESMHLHYHNAGHILKFSGWRNERVVAYFHSNGRIIQIVPEDSKIWWKKAKELMDLINRELGCFEMEFSLDHCQVFLYIKSRTIAGCVVAVPKTEGHKMLTTNQTQADLCSEETYPVKCGIPRIWVSRNHRKQGIASALMNAVKKNFMFGYILNNSDIALSAPTDMGKCFAKSYFESPNYLIYYA